MIRQHGQVQGELSGRRRSQGRCATGRIYEQPLRLASEQGKGIEVRRITVASGRPTREGETGIRILTNRPARAVTARQVAEVYRKRWTIEGLLFEASRTPSCEIDTLCYRVVCLLPGLAGV